MKKKKGFTLIELLVVIAIIAMLLAILMPALGKVKKLAMRLVCGTNLKGMANALNVYAFDYRDEYPIAGGKGAGPTTVGGWTGITSDWDNPSITDKATVSVAASLFMLVREADVGVKSFVCSGSDQQEFVNGTVYDVVELWDFGNGAAGSKTQGPDFCQSYSYQVPYRTHSSLPIYAADGTSSPGNAVMADRSPFFDTELTYSAPSGDNFLELVYEIVYNSSDKWAIQVGNSAPHDREGQNVLFNDGHVKFEKTPDVGTRYDNIYTTKQGAGTSGDDSARRNGSKPAGVGTSLVKSREDSVLVNDGNCM